MKYLFSVKASGRFCCGFSWAFKGKDVPKTFVPQEFFLRKGEKGDARGKADARLGGGMGKMTSAGASAVIVSRARGADHETGRHYGILMCFPDARRGSGAFLRPALWSATASGVRALSDGRRPMPVDDAWKCGAFRGRGARTMQMSACLELACRQGTAVAVRTGPVFLQCRTSGGISRAGRSGGNGRFYH